MLQGPRRSGSNAHRGMSATVQRSVWTTEALTESVGTCERNRESGWRDPAHSTRRKPRLARRQFFRGRPALSVMSSRHHGLVKAIRDPAPSTRLIPAQPSAGSPGRGRPSLDGRALSRPACPRKTLRLFLSAPLAAGTGLIWRSYCTRESSQVHGIDMRLMLVPMRGARSHLKKMTFLLGELDPTHRPSKTL